MTLTKILSRTPANVSRLALKVAGIAMVGFVLCPAAAHAQGGIPLWTNRYNGPVNTRDYASAIVVDSSNNVIVTGSSEGSDINNYYDYATIKYSSAGVPLWINRYDGPAHNVDYAIAVAVDGSNNVIVTGQSYNGSSDDYATIKYSSAGVPLWINRYNGPGNGNDSGGGLAVDGSNNVIVAGYSYNGANYDYATIAYTSAGVPLWTNRYNGPGNGDDYGGGIAVDGSNNVIVAGSSTGIGSGYDYATIQYSSAGVPLWTNRYNGPGNGDDYGGGIAVDGSNNVIVTGQSYNGTNLDYATIKYSSAGVPLWTNIYNGPGNDNDEAQGVAVDGSNNVIVAGRSYNGTDDDYVTIKYSSAGLPLWTNRYNGPGNGDDILYALAVDGGNNVFVTGSSYNGTNPDCATIAYSSAGVPLWTNRYNGPGNADDYGHRIAVDRSGNVIVTGSSYNGANYDYATIKYSSIILSPIPLNIQTAGNQMVLSWANAAFGLQSAPAVTGTFTNIPGAASPFTNPISGGQQFFRLQGN